MTPPADNIDSVRAFLMETDALKLVERRTYAGNRKRQECSAEHSWQLALMAIVLHEHANEKLDLLKVLKMLLIHDIPEVDVGDTFHYSKHTETDLYERESNAAKRIFGLLENKELAAELYALWEEFEARETPEAKFAAALDRTAPVLANTIASGGSWSDHKLTRTQVIDRCQHAQEGCRTWWTAMLKLLDSAVERGEILP